METRLPTVYRNYCRARNKVKNMIKYTRKQKEKCISGNIKNNSKAFWKYTKSKTKSNSTVSSLHVNPKAVLELGGFASQFATHFYRVANQFSKWFAVCESFYDRMDCIIIHLLHYHSSIANACNAK